MDAKQEMIKGILPETFGFDSIARCLMVYGWEKPIGPEWIDVIEDIFLVFGHEPFEGMGNLGELHSHGSYNRVRKRLRGFSENPNESELFAIRVRSSPDFIDEAFFPCNIEVSLGFSHSNPKKAVVAVREALISDYKELVTRIGKNFFDLFGSFYGGAWDFPAAFGPSDYMVSVRAIPGRLPYGINDAYANRITRWRDNIWHKKCQVRSGYFREIYPINFLLETHLNAPFRGQPLYKFMEKNGSLEMFEFNEKMHCWNITEENLDFVRKTLEPSGLVLSSAANPLYLE